MLQYGHVEGGISMLQNRLNVVLAERGLKANRVAVETGIARSTLSSLINNRSKMIQMETINTLCSFLKIDPGSFFEFSPYDFTFTIELNDGQFNHGSENYGEHWWNSFTNFQGDLFVTVLNNLHKDQVFELSFSCSDVRWEGVDDNYDPDKKMLIDVADTDNAEFAAFWTSHGLQNFFPTFVWNMYDSLSEQLLSVMNEKAKDALAEPLTEADITFKFGKMPINRY